MPAPYTSKSSCRDAMTRTLAKSATLYAATPADYACERKDCAVRALAVAANVPYARAHALLARAGRPPRKGARLYQIESAARCVGGIRLMLPNVATPAFRSPRRSPKCPTLAAVLAAHPGDRLLLTGLKHAFAVLDGKVHDWENSNTGLRSHIDGLWIFPGAQHRPVGVQSPA